MKKLSIIALLFAACKPANPDGLYVNHTQNQYSVTDDTLEVRDGTIISHSGYRKIKNGKQLPKEFKTKQLFELHPQFDGNKLILNQTIYEKI
jgi:hypothetical protein